MSVIHYEIAPVLRRDLPKVAALWAESVHHHVQHDDRFTPAQDALRHYLDYLHSSLVRQDHRLRVARNDDSLLGFCLTQCCAANPIFPHGPIGFLADLAVTASAKRMGIGQALTEDALAWLRRSGVRAVHVTVSVYNAQAQKFWRDTMGFRPYMDRLWLDI